MIVNIKYYQTMESKHHTNDKQIQTVKDDTLSMQNKRSHWADKCSLLLAGFK